MDLGLHGITLVDLGPAALCGIFILLVFTGRLVPRKTYDDKCHESNEWRSEGRLKDQQIAEKDEQIRDLLEVGKTVRALVRALPVVPRRGDDDA